MPIEENDGLFKGLKITLIILYSISLAGVVIMAVISILAIGFVGPMIKEDTKLSPEDKEAALVAQKTILIVAIVAYAITLLICIIALVGVVKENRCILITICVFGVLGVIGYVSMGRLVETIVAALSTGLDLLFTYMVCKRQKAN